VSPDRGKRTARRGSSSSRLRDARRSGLAIFAALLVALFAIVAIAQGIGRPDVPSNAIAVVEEVPGEPITVTDCHGDEVQDDPGTITRAEFDCAMRQTASDAQLPAVPEPGSPQYDQIREAAIGDLLDAAWLRGEASEQGITATEREIDAELQQTVSQSFPSCRDGGDPFECKELRQFLEARSLVEADVMRILELQVLSSELQQQITEQTPSVTAQEVEDYYEDAPEQFTLPASRDIRVVLNRDRAKVEEAKARLEADDSDQSWRAVARELSTDPVSKANGGLRQGLTEGLLEEPLNGQVFAASTEEIVGPVQTPIGFYVFQVEKVSPERTQELSQVQTQIRSQLAQVAEQETIQGFLDDFQSAWQARTICAEDFLVERCSNFVGSGHPGNASPACYEEDPEGGRPESCPAPVTPSSPALPGSVSVIAPQGLRLAQRPRPEGLQELQAPSLPGAGAAP
jgi:parvulin-like peptidyl-prolyl isomerase